MSFGPKYGSNIVGGLIAIGAGVVIAVVGVVGVVLWAFDIIKF